MKKPLIFEAITLPMSAGTTTLQRSHMFSDALELVMSPLGDGQFRTLRRPTEIDALIDALNKGKAAMIEAQTLKLSDLAANEFFRFTDDHKDVVRENRSDKISADWRTIKGDMVPVSVTKSIASAVVRIKATFEDVTE